MSKELLDSYKAKVKGTDEDRATITSEEACAAAEYIKSVSIEEAHAYFGSKETKSSKKGK